MYDIQNKNIYPTNNHSTSGEKNLNFEEAKFIKKPSDPQRSESEYLPHPSTQLGREWADKKHIYYIYIYI